jgi:ankyrin repeat protein
MCLAGLSGETLCAQDNLRFSIALLQLPQLAKPQISIDRALEEARLVREDRRRRMSFFEAIAANDHRALLGMLEEGMDPNAKLPLPVPLEFQNRFSDKVLRYYVSGEEGFTGLMLATALRNHALVKLLLQAGADPLKITKRHKTFALWLAAKQSDIEIMRSLMGIGPNHESQAFRITIDLLSQTALLWRNGKIVLSTPISSGRNSHPTPRGRFLITNKYRHWKSTLYPAKMPYFLRLSCGDFGLHMGALPGYPASHGCIRLPGKSAKRLYASVPIGTLVEIR